MTIGKERPNSLELMEKFYKAEQNIKDMNTELERIKNKMSTKLTIINTINAYTASLENSILNSSDKSSKTRILFAHNTDKIKGGRFDTYGQTVHAKYIQMPVNIFNVLTEAGAIFKDNVKVSIYPSDDGSEDWAKPKSAYKDAYKSILKHESCKDKEDVFEVFTEDRITIEIQLNTGSLIGMSAFDTIEICPYLPGSFDIEEIRLYTMQQYLEQNLISPIYYNGSELEDGRVLPFAEDVGNCRISMGESNQLYSIEIDIHINYTDGTGYPFGLRHLYFLRTAADTSSDYIIVEIEADDYIESIGKEIKLYTASGDIDDTYTSESYGIKYYMFYSNGVLDTEIIPDTTITRNIKTFYAKVPLKKPLIGIEFCDIILR